jgi:hypothetical protein
VKNLSREEGKANFKALLLAPTTLRGLATVIVGTATAFILLFLFPLIRPDEDILQAYTKQSLPTHAIAMSLVVGIALLAMLAYGVPKLWRSLRLGLLSLSFLLWATCVAIFWVLIDTHHPKLAITAIAQRIRNIFISYF